MFVQRKSVLPDMSFTKNKIDFYSCTYRICLFSMNKRVNDITFSNNSATKIPAKGFNFDLCSKNCFFEYNSSCIILVNTHLK